MEKVVLIDKRDSIGIRKFEARIEDCGNLVFDGWDLNKEAIMGIKEYEWTWTIEEKDVEIFYQALETSLPLLEAVRKEFDSEETSKVQYFLDEKGIPYKVWSWRS